MHGCVTVVLTMEALLEKEGSVSIYNRNLQLLAIEHDRFRVDIHSAHVLISITLAVFGYLNTALATENKVQDIQRLFYPIKQEAQV